MHARQNADGAGDRANVVEPPTVGTNARQDRFARYLLFDLAEHLADLLALFLLRDDRGIAGVGIGNRRRKFLDQVFLNLFDRIAAIMLARLALHFADLVRNASADGIDEARLGILRV